MTGAPTTVDPKKPIVHSDITRPRILGALSSWRIVLVSEVNETENAPTSAMATMARSSVGDTATTIIATPNSSDAVVRLVIAERLRPAATSPPTTAPAPIAAISSVYATALP